MRCKCKIVNEHFLLNNYKQNRRFKITIVLSRVKQKAKVLLSFDSGQIENSQSNEYVF